ncbi:MAG: hypothetical protein GY772_17325, partial [bacterium]|nr:hypothetical protein [bacterium]
MASGSIPRTPSAVWLDGDGASAQRPADVSSDSETSAGEAGRIEAGVGNIRPALGHQHAGNPGGWEDTTGVGASAQLHSVPPTPERVDFGRSPSPMRTWAAAVPAAPAAGAAPAEERCAAAEGGTTSAGASAQESPSALGIFTPRVALPNNYMGVPTLVDGFYQHGETHIPPVLPRLPPDAAKTKHILAWMPVKDQASLQTQQRNARRAGPVSGLDPGYGWQGKGARKGGKGGGKDKGEGKGFGPAKGKRGRPLTKGKGDRATRRFHRRGGRRSRSR